MKILITGAAGFIGYHVSKALATRGDKVLGIDIMNAYYDVSLKEARLQQLQNGPGFTFIKGDIADQNCIDTIFAEHHDIDGIINLAAQAGVLDSLTDPYSYIHSNITGFVTLLERAKNLKNLKHFVYASSSSVYGANKKQPSAIEDRVDKPVSLYAVTKKSNELIAQTYSYLFRIPTTGLRFFTVYGPWGRPDMAAFIFAKNIFADKEIDVYNHGKMHRNFTYIDDAVQGVLAALDKPATPISEGEPPSAIYNIGSNRTENLMDFVSAIEQNIGKKARINLMPLQPGDVKESGADIEVTKKDLGFKPKTNMQEGIKHLINWYKAYYCSSQTEV